MINYIWKDLIAAMRHLPYGIMAGILAVIILSVVNTRRRRKGKVTLPAAAYSGFFMYGVILLLITFLSRETGSRNGIDLELFSTWGISDRNNAFVIENILLFIPYGFVSAWAFTSMRNLLCCTLFGAVTSLGIEYLQLITERGYFQIDDILTNTLGTIAGYIVFLCARSIFR